MSRDVSVHSIFSSSGDMIECVSSARLLGVILSTDLRWNLHVESISAKARQELVCCWSRSKWLWVLYNSLVRSVLSYCFQAWCNASNHLIQTLKRLERRASRIIGSPPTVSLEEFLTRSCEVLANNILIHPNHPLRCVFSCHATCRSLRSSQDGKVVATPMFARTKRFQNSFTKFARP